MLVQGATHQIGTRTRGTQDDDGLHNLALHAFLSTVSHLGVELHGTTLAERLLSSEHQNPDAGLFLFARST
jgi:hypothetical protein